VHWHSVAVLPYGAINYSLSLNLNLIYYVLLGSEIMSFLIYFCNNFYDLETSNGAYNPTAKRIAYTNSVLLTSCAILSIVCRGIQIQFMTLVLGTAFLSLSTIEYQGVMTTGLNDHLNIANTMIIVGPHCSQALTANTLLFIIPSPSA